LQPSETLTRRNSKECNILATGPKGLFKGVKSDKCPNFGRKNFHMPSPREMSKAPFSQGIKIEHPRGI